MKVSIHYKGVFFDVPKEIFYSYFDSCEIINWHNVEFGESVFDRNGRAMFTLNSYDVNCIELELVHEYARIFMNHLIAY